MNNIDIFLKIFLTSCSNCVLWRYVFTLEKNTHSLIYLKWQCHEIFFAKIFVTESKQESALPITSWNQNLTLFKSSPIHTFFGLIIPFKSNQRSRHKTGLTPQCHNYISPQCQCFGNFNDRLEHSSLLCFLIFSKVLKHFDYRLNRHVWIIGFCYGI